MSRRNRRGGKNALRGDLGVAIAALGVFAQKLVMIEVRWPHSMAETIEMCFPAPALEASQNAQRYIVPARFYRTYLVPDPRTPVGDDWRYPPCAVRLKFGETPYQPIKEEWFLPPEELYNTIKKVVAIHERIGRVIALLRWLDKVASPAAIRYYLPSVNALAPGCINLEGEISRYVDPPGISWKLGAIREALATIACCLLLPANVDTPETPLTICITTYAGSESREYSI
jgi:hypothetical protein